MFDGRDLPLAGVLLRRGRVQIPERGVRDRDARREPRPRDTEPGVRAPRPTGCVTPRSGAPNLRAALLRVA